MMKHNTGLLAAIVVLALPSANVLGFTTVTSLTLRSIRPPDTTSLDPQEKWIGNLLVSAALISVIAIGANPALADEYGKETEAPTLFTGETVMICVKRGPLGACTRTEERTAINDNDRSNAYFKDPATTLKQRRDVKLMAEESEGNALIQKLRQQSDENREKNDLAVRQKTLINDQSASFGPFDRQVVILNTDGRTFTLLENPQAMRLKNAGFIEDRKFIKQPTKEELEDALVLPVDDAGFTGLVRGLFAGSGD